MPGKEELNGSGCCTTGTCPTGVLLRASTGPCACATGGLSLLSSHQLDKKAQKAGGGVFVLTGTFLGRPHGGPPNVATPARRPWPPAISSDLARRPGVFLLRLVRRAPDHCRRGWPTGVGSRACDWAAWVEGMRKAGPLVQHVLAPRISVGGSVPQFPPPAPAPAAFGP